MKKTNPSYIQVNKDFSGVLDRFAVVLYEKSKEKPAGTQSEFNKLVYQSINQVLFPADIDSAKLKYNEPKLQFTKSGPLGTASYAAPRERQDYARRLPSVPFKQTPARRLQQSRMQLATTAWNSIDTATRAKWDRTAKVEQNFTVSLFCGIYMQLLSDNRPIPDPFLPTPELLKYYHSRK